MAKVEDRVAKRYARALLGLSQQSDPDAVKTALEALSKSWTENAELRNALQNPATPIDQRISVMKAIGQRLVGSSAVSDVFVNFLSVLLINGRLRAIPQVAVFFKDMLDELKKVLALEVTSAFPLSESEKQDLQGRLQREYGRLASINWNVDREILGGLVIKYGDRLLDASVRGSLESLRTQLSA
jgi:F-type H+-transporting ATPase subunit delta